MKKPALKATRGRAKRAAPASKKKPAGRPGGAQGSRAAWTLTDRRLDRRSARTVEQILNSTIALMQECGSEKLAISAVCRAAGVSRGTLYRYFSSKADLLDGVTLHLRDQTDQAVRALSENSPDPMTLLHQIIDYTLHSPEIRQGARFLTVEPAFVINYLRRNFQHFRRRLDEAMEPIFALWADSLDAPIDRQVIVDMLVRYALSEMLVPAGRADEQYPARIEAMIRLLRGQVKVV